MMRLTSIAIIAAAAFMLVACEKSVDIALPNSTPRLVVNGSLTPDSSITIYVGHTTKLFDDSPNYLEDLQPLVEVNNTTIVLDSKGKGIYKAVRAAKAGEKYNITVSASGYSTVSATAEVPQPPRFNKLKVKRTLLNQLNNIQFSMVIVDPKETRDYYIVEVQSTDESSTDLPITSTDPATEPQQFSYQDQLLISDKSFNGQNKKIRFSINNSFFITKASSFKVKLKRCTPELWEYKSAYFLYLANAETPTSIPMQMYTNINNGVGIFGGHAIYTEVVSIP